MGAGLSFVIYSITQELFDQKSARLAMILTAFFPSLFFWSLSYIKDIPFVFLSATLVLSFLKLYKTKKISYAIIIFLSIALQYSLRPQFHYIIAIFLFSAYYFIFCIKNYKKKILVALCGLLFLPLALRDVNFSKITQDKIELTALYSRGIIMSHGKTYKIFHEKY